MADFKQLDVVDGRRTLRCRFRFCFSVTSASIYHPCQGSPRLLTQASPLVHESVGCQSLNSRDATQGVMEFTLLSAATFNGR